MDTQEFERIKQNAGVKPILGRQAQKFAVTSLDVTETEKLLNIRIRLKNGPKDSEPINSTRRKDPDLEQREYNTD